MFLISSAEGLVFPPKTASKYAAITFIFLGKNINNERTRIALETRHLGETKVS
jgi:hypothetical protein